MSKFKAQGFNNTFKNARKGMRLVLKSEVNIRVHFIVGAVVLILAFLLGFSIPRICILLLTIGFVIVAEMINSAVEFSLDAVFRNKYNRLVGIGKRYFGRCSYVCNCYSYCYWYNDVWFCIFKNALIYYFSPIISLILLKPPSSGVMQEFKLLLK